VEEVGTIDPRESRGELRTVNRWIGEWGEDIVSVPGADPLAMLQQLKSLSENTRRCGMGRVWGGGGQVGCDAICIYSIE
jgi:hypothetical protein